MLLFSCDYLELRYVGDVSLDKVDLENNRLHASDKASHEPMKSGGQLGARPMIREGLKLCQ